ncbi:MAG: type II secretion system F family protein [Elusimicrobiota bacterium]|nr:type II secretion system F family protein [Elusimicrobiota bacterium]
MAQFKYRVRTQTGAVQEAVLEAPDVRAATERLRAKKFIVLEISEVETKWLATLKSLFAGKVKSKDLCLFSRQLSTLISSGVPIVQGLGILEAQIQSKVFKNVVSKVREDIEAGVSIADAMQKHPKVFSELYVAMIRSGEVGGILDVILDRLASYLESLEELKGKIKSAMTYPLVLAIIAVGAAIFMLTGVIPQFAGLFEGIGIELPLPTRMMLLLSNIIKKNLPIVVFGTIILFVGFKQLIKRLPAIRFRVDAIKLKLPVFGVVITKMAIAKFTRTFATLIKSGVPILQALETVAKTAGNMVLEKAILQSKEAIREGERIADPLRKCGVFPGMVIQMVAVGEETGALDTMLTKVADFYDREVDDAVKAMTSMIEPLIIVFMGGIIGSMVLALFLPMFELTSKMAAGG